MTDPLPPLLLLSGLLCDRFVWEEVARRMNAIARTSIVDFAGCRSIPEMADKVLTAAPERFALAGHSMGGRVALEVTRQAPERVSRLALLNTGVHPRRESEVPGRERLLAIAASDGMAAVADAWLPPMVGPIGLRNSTLMSQLKQMVLRHSPEVFEGQILALLNRPNAEDVLARIDVPVLLLSGDEDRWSPASQHDAMHRKLRGSKFVVLAGVGHMSTVEAPFAVANALRSWLVEPAASNSPVQGS